MESPYRGLGKESQVEFRGFGEAMGYCCCGLTGDTHIRER